MMDATPTPPSPDTPLATPPDAPRRRAGPVLYLLGAVLVGGAAWATWKQVEKTEAGLGTARAAMEAEAARGPRIILAAATQGPKERRIQLLGDARPFATTTLFAKVSGYVKAVYVDKGALVKTGDVIAEIESAEIESQYQVTVADLEYKTRLAQRARELLRTGSTSQQAADLAEANMRMAQEQVRNLGTMRSYQTLRAPFDGTVIARFADPGALMQAATTNQSSALPVVQLADNSRLRVGVYVEQRDVAAVQVGSEAEVADAANPERRRTARISRTAGTLDPRTRTLFVEIDLENQDGFLVPGSFVNVILKVPVASYPQVPVSAVVNRGGNTYVGAIGDDAIVRFRPIRIANTDGIMANVAEGLKPGERVGLNIATDIAEGMRVRPVQPGQR